MAFARIMGTGSYLPDRVLTNGELSQSLDTTDDWIRARSGILERRIAADDEFTCDLAEHAARRALENAGRSFDDIDPVSYTHLTLPTTP